MNRLKDRDKQQVMLNEKEDVYILTHPLSI